MRPAFLALASATVVAVIAASGCRSVDVIRSTSPSPYRADSRFWIEPIHSGAAADQPLSSTPGAGVGGDVIDPASVDIEQANRVFRAAARARGLDVNLGDGDIRPVEAMEIRATLLRLASTGGGDGNRLTVIGPGVRTTIDLGVAVVAPDGRTVDELRFTVSGPFYESLEGCAARIAGYLQGRGAGRLPPPVPVTATP